MVFCHGCAAEIHVSAPTCPKCGAPQIVHREDLTTYTFQKSVALCFNRYVQFSGRAPRAEFWYFNLFVFLVTIGTIVMGAVVGHGSGAISGLFYLGIMLPSLSVLVRRLHDVDRSGWWYWIGLIPLVGSVILLVWFCQRGTVGPNRFGPDCLAARRLTAAVASPIDGAMPAM